MRIFLDLIGALFFIAGIGTAVIEKSDLMVVIAVLLLGFGTLAFASSALLNRLHAIAPGK